MLLHWANLGILMNFVDMSIVSWVYKPSNRTGAPLQCQAVLELMIRGVGRDVCSTVTFVDRNHSNTPGQYITKLSINILSYSKAYILSMCSFISIYMCIYIYISYSIIFKINVVFLPIPPTVLDQCCGSISQIP